MVAKGHGYLTICLIVSFCILNKQRKYMIITDIYSISLEVTNLFPEVYCSFFVFVLTIPSPYHLLLYPYPVYLVLSRS